MLDHSGGNVEADTGTYWEGQVVLVNVLKGCCLYFQEWKETRKYCYYSIQYEKQI